VILLLTLLQRVQLALMLLLDLGALVRVSDRLLVVLMPRVQLRAFGGLSVLEVGAFM